MLDSMATGGDADVDIDVNAGGDMNVSVNGGQLANLSDIPRGTGADLFTYLEVRRLSKWSSFIDYAVGWIGRDLTRNIQEDWAYREATDNHLTKIGFEQDSQNFLIELNQSQIDSLKGMADSHTATEVELRGMIEEEMAYSRALEERYDNILFGAAVVVGVFLLIIFGLVISLLRRTI